MPMRKFWERSLPPVMASSNDVSAQNGVYMAYMPSALSSKNEAAWLQTSM